MIFCRRHIGIPLERAPGEWIHSVTTPHELLPLLGRIFRIAVTTTEHGPALAAPETQVASNDDMMIRWWTIIRLTVGCWPTSLARWDISA